MKVSEGLEHPSPGAAGRESGVTTGGTGGAVMTGAIVSLLLVVMSISYPSLIFSGRLEPYSGPGMQMALFSAVVFCLTLSVLSTSPGIVGIAQGETAAVLGLAAASIAEHTAVSGNAHQVIPTVMATIVLGALLMGVLFILIGSFRFGNIIRFVPLPVMGGFLAGVGWLLANGAMKSLTGSALSVSNIAGLLQPEMILKWLPGLVSAVVLLFLQRRRRTAFNLIGVVALSVVFFWLAAWLSGTPRSALKAGGWLIATDSGQSRWTPLDYAAMLTDVDWSAVASQLPQLGTLLVIASICLLMAASSLELLSGKDMDLNRELIAAGVGNLFCAAAGSLPGYHSLAASALGQKMGTPSRIIGLIGAIFCAATYFVGVTFLSILPRLLVGTVILYVALSLLIEWLHDTWYRLSRADYAILLLVFGCVGFVGLVTGVAVGLVAGMVLFAVDYGRISIAKQVGSSATIRSNVVYPDSANAALREHGNESYIVKLQGFIFFGTSNRLLAQIRTRMQDGANSPLRTVALDFKHVFGLDSSAAFSFLKLRRYAEQVGFSIALSRLAPHVDNSLKAAGLYENDPSRIRKFDDLDHALEYCEKMIVSGHLPMVDGNVRPISNQLAEAFQDEGRAASFRGYLERVDLPMGGFLVRNADAYGVNDDIFFIERGRVAVVVESAGGGSSRTKSLGPGTVFDVGSLLRGARGPVSVLVEEDLTAHRLTGKSLDAMSEDDPGLVIAFQKFMMRMLVERLADADQRSRPVELLEKTRE